MISIVMQSYLGEYPNAAKDRDVKLIRAIKSVQLQSYKEWELIIVADGCQKTLDIAGKYINDQIRLFSIEKQRNWSGIPRNVGIERAKGKWICYLDVDDVFGIDHLKGLHENLNTEQWYLFNDYVYNGTWIRRMCHLQQGQCGTSNIIHRNNIEPRWEQTGTYSADDWLFIRKLIKLKYKRIEAGEYHVCHIPFKGGYDI